MKPVGKHFVVAVDVSTSLSSIVPGTALSTAAAAAAVTMVSLEQSEYTVAPLSEGNYCTVRVAVCLGGARLGHPVPGVSLGEGVGVLIHSGDSCCIIMIHRFFS